MSTRYDSSVGYSSNGRYDARIISGGELVLLQGPALETICGPFLEGDFQGLLATFMCVEEQTEGRPSTIALENATAINIGKSQEEDLRAVMVYGVDELHLDGISDIYVGTEEIETVLHDKGQSYLDEFFRSYSLGYRYVGGLGTLRKMLLYAMESYSKTLAATALFMYLKKTRGWHRVRKRHEKKIEIRF